MRTSTLAALALLGALLLPATLMAQEPGPFRSIFNGQNLNGWDTRSLDGWDTRSGVDLKRVTVTGGVLRLTGDSGWLLATGTYRDFVLRFEAKLTRGSVGGVLFGTRAEGFRVRQVRIADGSDRGGALFFRGAKIWVEAVPTNSSAPTGDDWHSFTIECHGKSLRVLIDGRIVQDVAVRIPENGWLGFHVERGVVELRNIEVQEPPAPANGVVARVGEEDVTMPVMMHHVNPTYTSQAMKDKIQGEVRLDCVVLPDGTVGPVTVVRSLDSRLDAQAVAAAKKCRFKPGTREGRPVPALVSIEMWFSIR